MVKNYGYAAKDLKGHFSPLEYEIREPGEDEILVKVKYCGICHSDIHMSRGELFPPEFPIVTGHEFIGEVTKLGPMKQHTGEDAKRNPEWKVGDIVGVGCMVNSCQSCEECNTDWENHCAKAVFTYGVKDHTGEQTRGGYGKYVVLNRRFGIRIPAGVDYKDAAPLLCAGITMFSPIHQRHMERGNLRIGVMGLGGLGHMAVQYASKINKTNEVIVFSRSKKKEEAAKKLGAKSLIAIGDAYADGAGQIVNSNPELSAVMGTFHYLIDTISSPKKPMSLFTELLRAKGCWIMVSVPPPPVSLQLPGFQMLVRAKQIAFSVIGGIAETQEMVDYSFKHNIMPWVEHIKADQINEAIERVISGDINFRFVIDIEDSYAGHAET